MRYDRIDGLRPEYPVRMLCRLLNVSEAGYYAWRRRPPSPRAQENARLSIEIKLAHERTRQTYGPERLQAELADHGIHAGIDRIKRIRRELGLRCRQKRKFKVTTDSRHHLPIAPNLLDRQFAVSAPNRVWVTDITYVATDEGWLYLAGIKDRPDCGNGHCDDLQYRDVRRITRISLDLVLKGRNTILSLARTEGCASRLCERNNLHSRRKLLVGRHFSTSEVH